MSKVTSRTLRHYDEIGLLPPAWVGGNGYRYYEREQLVRLQQILVMRELGVGLDTIAEIVHQGRDQIETLRMHRKWLLAERDRFEQLANTVSRTIEDLKGGDNVNPKMDHWFEGFTDAKAAEYEAEAKQRWGAEEVEKANRGFKGNAADWWRENGAVWAEQLNALVALIDAGSAPDSPEALDAIDGHYRWLSSGFWVPNRESYTGLGNLYADDPRFRKNFDRTDPRLAEFLRAAMAAYAQERLQ